MLALVTLVAPLAAALLSVVLPPIRHRGAPAAMLTILGSPPRDRGRRAAPDGGRGGARHPRHGALDGRPGQGSRRGGSAARRRVHPHARGGLPGGPGNPDLLGRVHAWRVATLLDGRFFAYHALLPLQHGHPGAGAGPAPGVRRVGAGRAGQLPPHRLPLRPPERCARRGEGVLDDQARGHGLPVRAAPPLRAHRGLLLGRGAPSRGGRGGGGTHLPRGDGQVRPVPAARVAPRRDGGPDAGLGACIHAATMVAAGVYLWPQRIRCSPRRTGCMPTIALDRHAHGVLAAILAAWSRPTSSACSRTRPSPSWAS